MKKEKDWEIPFSRPEPTPELEQAGFSPLLTAVLALRGIETPEQARQLPFDLYRDGYEYYLQTHAHPGSTFRYTKSSLVDLMAFDASEGMYLVNQPLLMMAGGNADTFYMTEQCFSKATGTQDKELFLVPGATHIQTYWVPEYVDQAVTKLTEFFGKRL